MRVALLIYALGAIVGFVRTDARPLARVGLALAWPVGPLVFVVVVSGLLLAALYIFPIFGGLVAVGALGAWWLLS